MSQARHRVAIIGAGPAGIVALRALTHPPSEFDVTAFEQTGRAGGIWNYDRAAGPMYYNLRTNLPRPVMGFHDYPFTRPSDTSFPTHQEVLEYINEYLDKMIGRDLIKFHTKVVHVTPVTEDEDSKWLIRTAGKDGEETEATFDTVFVCNGHYEISNIPALPGIDKFCGQVLHSMQYKVPEEFSGKKVVLLGAMASGQDIAVDIAPYAKEVVVSHAYRKLPCQLPSNVSQVAAVTSFEDNRFRCSDGCSIDDVDVFMFCTGYQYWLPFLDERCGVSIIEGRCHPLWKHIVNIVHPSMFFIGICQKIAPMPHFAMQCAFARAIMEGRFKLPSSKAMFEDLEADYQLKVVLKGAKPRHLHLMRDNDQWEYNDELAELAQYPKLPSRVGRMYAACGKSRRDELMSYRNYFFELLPGDDFTMRLASGNSKSS